MATKTWNCDLIFGFKIGIIMCIRLIALLLISLPLVPSQADSTSLNQPVADSILIQSLKQHVLPFHGNSPDLIQLSEWVGDSQFVLLGDSTHGTREFYQIRAKISQYLIENKGFNTVILEANWPGGYRVNQYIHGKLEIDETKALSGFRTKYPWVWRNHSTAEFIRWLRGYNLKKKASQTQISFYGMDLFSLYPSLANVVKYLKTYNLEATKIAQAAHQCFKQHQSNPNIYGYNSIEKPQLSCKKQASMLLGLFDSLELADPSRNKNDAFFNARMNAKALAAAEYYARLVAQENIAGSWNQRENFMKTIINDILHYQHHKKSSKVIIWAHNSHVGDALATAMKDENELSLGQLLREHYGKKNVFLLGSLTNRGTVTSAAEWNGVSGCMTLPKAVNNSYSELFNRVNIPRFLVELRKNQQLSGLLNKPRNQRFVGVVYQPMNDQQSNYFPTTLSQQFDAVLFMNKTNATLSLDYPCQ